MPYVTPPPLLLSIDCRRVSESASQVTITRTCALPPIAGGEGEGEGEGEEGGGRREEEAGKGVVCIIGALYTIREVRLQD